jgi:hypothetical protein
MQACPDIMSASINALLRSVGIRAYFFTKGCMRAHTVVLMWILVVFFCVQEILSKVVYEEQAHPWLVTIRQLVGLTLLRRQR